MKHSKLILLWLVFWSLLAACVPPAEPISVTRPVTAVATPTAPATPTTSPTVTLTPWITVTPNTTATVPGPPPTPETAVPTSSQLEQPVAAADKITIGDWSPDGRYFTYWTHTPEDVVNFMPGDFYIYDAEQAQSCPFSDYRTGATSWKRRHLWLPNGEILIFGDEDVTAFQPCNDDFAILTDRFPESITRVVTATANRSHFLLTSQDAYWLYQPAGHQVQPVAEFNQGMEGGAAFSPDGRFHLRLETAKEDAPLRLYHSETDEYEAINLPGTHASYVNSPENEHWLLLRAYTEDNRTELWVRPIDPANSPPQRLAAHEETMYPRAAPVGDHAAVGYSDKIEVLTLPDATLLASYAVTEQTIYPLGFSPDGRFLVIRAYNSEGEETLFIQPISSP